MLDMKELAKEIHETAVDKGWWQDCFSPCKLEFDPTLRNVGETFLLMQSEISEAFEEYRDGRAVDEIYTGHGAKPEGVPIELADCIIRIMDFCEANKIDLELALRLKVSYNKTRPYRHGGKAA